MNSPLPDLCSGDFQRSLFRRGIIQSLFVIAVDLTSKSPDIRIGRGWLFSVALIAMSENFRFTCRLLLSVLILRPCLSYNPKQELVSKFLDYDSQVSSRSASMIPDESFKAMSLMPKACISIDLGHKVAFAHHTP